MTDPYKTLGVDRSMSDEEIKQAYRALVRKYHPDRYPDPDLAEIATEKMKEINAAYEEIQAERRNEETFRQSGAGGADDGSAGGGGANRDQSAGDARYQSTRDFSGTRGGYNQVRYFINEGDLDGAEVLLRGVPEGRRTAEWYFLTGCVLLRRGYFVDAQANLDYACRLDPYNSEYRTVCDRLRAQLAATGARGGTADPNGEVTGCDICSSLMLMNCCCHCMGGDQLRCC